MIIQYNPPPSPEELKDLVRAAIKRQGLTPEFFTQKPIALLAERVETPETEPDQIRLKVVGRVS